MVCFFWYGMVWYGLDIFDRLVNWLYLTVGRRDHSQVLLLHNIVTLHSYGAFIAMQCHLGMMTCVHYLASLYIAIYYVSYGVIGFLLGIYFAIFD